MDPQHFKSGRWVRRVAGRGLILAGLLGAVSAPAASDSLRLLDGSQLHGKLLGIGGEGLVRWEHPEALRPIEFRTGKLHQLVLEAGKHQPDAAATCRVLFGNGDEIIGDLLSLDEKRIRLNTWFAGKLDASRDAVRSLTFSHAGVGVKYRGPNGSEGWNMLGGQGRWHYEDGSFYTTNSAFLGRHFNLGDSSRIEFDIEWTDYLNLLVTVYTEQVDRFSFSSPGYLFSISTGFVSLQRVQGVAGRTFLGQAQVDSLASRRKATIEIRTDKKSNSIHLYVNGELIQQWGDPLGFAGQGGGITFYSQRNGSALRLSRIEVADWNGAPTGDLMVPTNQVETVVRLMNRDQFAGSVPEIRDGKARLATSRVNLDVPIERVSQIVFPPDGSRAPANKGLVRATFGDRGKLTLDLQDWSPGEVRGRNPWFGQMTLKPEWIQKLRFNLNEEVPDAPQEALLDDPFWPKEDKE